MEKRTLPVCGNSSTNSDQLQASVAVVLSNEEGKTIKSVDDEIPLPEAMIHHIQSFMSREEAARSTILSKSWYNAWLTRPILDFDSRDFNLYRPESQHMFEEFVTTTMQRYLNLSLNIDSFRLCSYGSSNGSYSWGHNLIVDAMKMGATTVELDYCSLPKKVLGSETLLKLSLINCCEVDGNYDIRCSRLKSLTLEHLEFRSDDVFKGLISCCILLEELSLFNCYNLALERMKPFELHKLRRLFLHYMDAGRIFSTNFSSRFPSLKDLSIIRCYGCTNVQIASTSLETICLIIDSVSEAAKFDVPNVREFTFSCPGLPSRLYIKGPSREWEFDISIESYRLHKMSWFINLKKLLKMFRLSRISLCINLYPKSRLRGKTDSNHEVDVKIVPNPLVVENLTINAPPTFYGDLLARSLEVFRPKFITE